MANRITLRQVADYAGVSVTTVSNVIRGWPHISTSTRTKVEAAIDKLGYTPHPIAQGLRTGHTQIIGFIVPDLANPHFAAMADTVEYIAREKGYNVLIFNSHDDRVREYQCIQDATQRWVDGLIFIQAADVTNATDTLSGVNFPVVAIDRIPHDFDGPSCRIDNMQISNLVMEHLYALGHRRIAHLAGPLSAQIARERLDGYHASLKKYHLTYRMVVACEGSWNMDAGYAAMQKIINSGEPLPGAIFASNDSMAIGALHALDEAGYHVPDDISVVGVDDIEMCRYLHPPLTTVMQPMETMARTGIEMLLKLIDNETLDTARVALMPELMVRKSTAAPGEST